MSAGHAHSHVGSVTRRDQLMAGAVGGSGQGGSPGAGGAPAGVRWALAVLVGVIVVATGVGMALLWPRGPLPKGTMTGQTYPGGSIVQARVDSTRAYQCAGTSDDRMPDGSVPATVTCVRVGAHLTGGSRSGRQISVQVAPQVYQAGIGRGDLIEVVRIPASAGLGEAYAWVDFARDLPLGVLAVVFAVAVVAVARLRGVAALVGLGLGYLTVLRFMLPALLRGESGAGVALVGSVAIMVVILYVAHGISAKTTTALLGTVAGLAVTAGLAVWASGAAHLNGLTSEDNYTLSMLMHGQNLSGLILCGIIVAGLGVLNDVTVTQASAVWELHEQAPHLSRGRLFGAGMRIGRDHLASTVYTIAFAYAGVALPTLLLIDLYQQPVHQVLTGGQMAEEIVRTLVGAIGLVLAIPLTTAIAAVVVSVGAWTQPRPPARPYRHVAEAAGPEASGDGPAGSPQDGSDPADPSPAGPARPPASAPVSERWDDAGGWIG